jgi:hypothetical protein
MQLVLALLKRRRVSLSVAWRVLSPKRFLTTGGVRTYTQWYAQMFMLRDKEK